LGKLGNPELGGLPLGEFKRRQALHRSAEIAAMKDVPAFIDKARGVYGYDHFVTDAGGSLCELEDPEVIETLARHTLILYIRATGEDEEELRRRAHADPKPLYYRPEFLEAQLATYLREHRLDYVALIDPDDFVRWVFPILFRERVPRYQEIASRHGYTATTEEVSKVEDADGFVDLLERVMERQPRPS
ncbi:MAG: ATPase, partial [Thermoanaerobaculia bacterium]